MELTHGETAPRRRAKHSSSGSKRAADSRAAALASTIRQLMAAGFVSQRELAGELNRRGIPTALGGSWHRNTVVRVLRRVGLPIKRAADVRAETLGPTIRKLRKAGFVSIKAIAHELNERGIAAPRGGKWHLTMVIRLLQRLDRLDRISRGQHRR
jgi:hypothetical protein